MIGMNKIDKISQLYIEKLVLPSYPLCPMWNRENFLFSKPGKWNYIDGCMIKAVTMLYELSGDDRLLDYAVRFTDAYVGENGLIPSMNPLDYNLDNINGGKNLIYLFRTTHKEKYRLAFERLYGVQLKNQPRLACGNFYHKAIYPRQIWLDGAYMALPFMAEYALNYGSRSIFDDIRLQLENINRLMMDELTGLYRHGYDEARSTCWADPETGLSDEFWLRAMGWYCAALADLCETAKNVSALYSVCSESLKQLLTSLSGYITEEDMLYQLPAKTELDGNYPETSGTLLFSYAALKSYRLGVCGEKIKTDGVRTLSAVTENFISLTENDLPVMKNICLMAGLGGKECRNGSERYYLGEPVVENDAKGIAPYLMAYAELKRITSQ